MISACKRKALFVPSHQQKLFELWSSTRANIFLQPTMGVFDKWLMFNAFLDWIPLGIVPILGLGPLPGPKIEDFFDGPASLAHRQCAWFFMTAGCARFAAGYGRSAVAKRLALISYIFEAVMFAVEIKQGTTTFERAAGGIVIPLLCAGLILAGYPATNTSSRGKSA